MLTLWFIPIPTGISPATPLQQPCQHCQNHHSQPLACRATHSQPSPVTLTRTHDPPPRSPSSSAPSPPVASASLCLSHSLPPPSPPLPVPSRGRSVTLCLPSSLSAPLKCNRRLHFQQMVGTWPATVTLSLALSFSGQQLGFARWRKKYGNNCCEIFFFFFN